MPRQSRRQFLSSLLGVPVVIGALKKFSPVLRYRCAVFDGSRIPPKRLEVMVEMISQELEIYQSPDGRKLFELRDSNGFLTNKLAIYVREQRTALNAS